MQSTPNRNKHLSVMLAPNVAKKFATAANVERRTKSSLAEQLIIEWLNARAFKEFLGGKTDAS